MDKSTQIRKLQKELKKRKKLRYYRSNPMEWMVDKLNFDSRSIRWSKYNAYSGHEWDDKDPDLITPDPLYRVLRGLARKEDVGIEAATGVGKCVTKDTIVFTDSGPKRIGQFMNGSDADTEKPLSDTTVSGRKGHEKASKAYYSGVKTSYHAKTSQGFEIGGSGKHRVRVLEDDEIQWKHVKDIETEDRVAIQRGADLWADENQITEQDGYVLGLLVGDGGYTQDRNVTFSSGDRKLSKNVAQWINRKSGTLPRITHTIEEDGKDEFGFLSTEFRDRLKTEYDLPQDKSGEKSVPDSVMKSRREVVVAFLRGLFDTDGTVDQGGRPSLTTVSEDLAEEVQMLLLNLGIIAKRETKKTSWTHNDEYNKSTAKRIFMAGKDADLFFELIGFELDRKQEKRVDKTRNANLDVVPINDTLRSLWKKIKRDTKWTERRLNTSNEPRFKSWIKPNGSDSQRHPTYEGLKAFIEKYPEYEKYEEFRKIQNIVEKNYFFDVVQETWEDESELYDLYVPTTNSYNAGGFMNHNTYLAAAICLWFVDCWPKINDPETGEVLDPGGMVVTVATKEQQLRQVIWKEIENFKPLFSNIHPQAEWMDLKIRMSPDQNDGSKEGWGIFGQTASVSADEEVSTKFSGIHGPHMLFVMDEAPGIDKPILEAIENTCTGNHNLRLALGNPKSQNDTLHEFCTQKRVNHVRASALDHPNVVLGKEIIPGAVTRKSINRRMDKYQDPNHRIILRRVHGVSPSTSGMTLFSDKAIQATKQYAKKGPWKRFEVRPPAKGDLRIYRKRKTDKLNRYVIFADVAGDRSEDGDWHAAVVLDRETREIAAVLHMRGPRTKYVGELMNLAELYVIPYGTTGNRNYDSEKGEFVQEKRKFWPLLAYERDSVGGLHMDDRIKEYENIYHQRKTDMQQKGDERKTIGWSTNKSTRPDMIDALEEWGLSLRNHPERLPDKNLWDECRTFVFNESHGKDGKWEADTGCHDDLVMATAGALTVDLVTDSYMRETADFEEDEDETNMPPKIPPGAEESSDSFDQHMPEFGTLP